MGHEVVFDNNADVSLVFIERTGEKLCDKVVHRLDGIWSSQKDFEQKNRSIKQTYDIADAVVFQSEFDKSVVTKLFGYPKSCDVIHNGTHLVPIREHKFTGLEKLRQEFDFVYSCSAMWHPQKRLATNVELFKHLRSLSPDKKSCLIVLGTIDNQQNYDLLRADTGIFYAGCQPLDVCAEVYAMSTAFLHLSFADHCPNVITHALSQETPCVVASSGGTKEIVKDFGIVIKEECELEPGHFDWDSPPIIDVKQIVQMPLFDAMCNMGSHADVSIKNVAKKYVELLESVIRS
jgi:glycosyltransferase involved in cell wall biosynthesis